MKKTLTIIIALTISISLYGCGKSSSSNSTKQNTSTNKTIVYKDGTYDAIQKSTKPGYEEAVVTIKAAKVTSIVLKRLDDNKVELNYDQWDGTSGGRPNLKQARIDLANEMMTKVSTNVDTISGATESSNGWILAATNALNKAK
jgi:uncharacterized protein with FMN-binding domain